MNALQTYVLERVFDAPRELVWRTWTEPALLARWYGPNVETIVHRLDVEPGGLWLNEMKMDGGSYHQRSEYTEVIPPERLVMLMSNTDSDWNVTANPMMPDWPRVMLTTVTFTEAGGKMQVRLVWTPYEATDTEIACFAGAMEGFGSGWGAGFTIMDDILKELQA